jgi:peptidoglycan/LPS O-acetylase OafA/YrhL
VLTIAAAPIATLGYLGLIAALSRPPGPIMAKALKAGESSLSIYLGQSIILSTIFSGYGLGLWGSVDRLTAVAVALAVTVILIVVSAIWRFRFRLGPFEWVLRRITYFPGSCSSWWSGNTRRRSRGKADAGSYRASFDPERSLDLSGRWSEVQVTQAPPDDPSRTYA